MSDLEAFRAHAREMAAMTVPVTVREPCRDGSCPSFAQEGVMVPIRWHTHAVVTVPLPSDAERALWRQLASEIDAYLSAEDDDMLPIEETR